jgi:hypothetical protein
MAREGKFGFHRLREEVLRYYGNVDQVPKGELTGSWAIPDDVKDEIFHKLEEADAARSSVWTLNAMVKQGEFGINRLRSAIIRYYGGKDLVPKDRYGHWSIPAEVKDEIFRVLNEADVMRSGKMLSKDKHENRGGQELQGRRTADEPNLAEPDAGSSTGHVSRGTNLNAKAIAAMALAAAGCLFTMLRRKRSCR